MNWLPQGDEMTATVALEKLSCTIIILDEHIRALKKCNISLEDCVGPEVVKAYSTICREILTPLITAGTCEKFGVKQADLINVAKKYGGSCLKNSQALATAETDQTLKTLYGALKRFTETKKVEDSFTGLFEWLNTQDNIELIANKVVAQNVDCIELLNIYFAIEAEYFCDKTRRFTKNDTTSSPIQLCTIQLHPHSHRLWKSSLFLLATNWPKRKDPFRM
jgi:hypothetical protein